MEDKISNHDELVRLILRRIGPLKGLKHDILAKTGRRYITRPTIRRAMETALKYLLANELYSPAMDDWRMEGNHEAVSVKEGQQLSGPQHSAPGSEVPSTPTC